MTGTQKLLIDVVTELKKRGITTINLHSLCFPEQLRFLEDTSPFVTAVTSRRAGKTTACALDLLKTARSSSSVVVLYITLARINASRIVWPILKQLNHDNLFGGEINETNLSIRLPNKSIIYCSGAKDQREVDKFLGLPLKLVYIDEAQSFRPYLTDLIDRVLAPALLDHAGTIKVIGTPGALPVGPFWELAKHPQWSHHEWTFFNNPWLVTKSGFTHQALLDRELKRRGVSVNDPTIQREFFGKWVYDSDSLVFKYDSVRNDYVIAPQAKYTYILGIDLGFEDADALAIIGWNDTDKTTFLFDEQITQKQGLSELVQQIEAFRRKYDFAKIVMDMGGLGKKLGEEIIRRYQVPVQPAEKQRKYETIELFNDALRTGKFRARNTSRFAQDAMLMEWDLDKSTPERKVVSDRFHSDICDAVLYAWRESYSFTSEAVAEVPKYGSPAWAKREVEDMEEQAEDYFRRLENSDGFGIL